MPFLWSVLHKGSYVIMQSTSLKIVYWRNGKLGIPIYMGMIYTISLEELPQHDMSCPKRVACVLHRGRDYGTDRN